MQDNKSRGDNRCCRMVGDRFRPLRLSGESSSFRCTNRNNSRSSTNIEQRQQFAAMSAMDKQQYLAQRNLLLPNPSANWGQQVQLQRHTIQVSWSDSDGKLLANVPSKKIIYYFP